MVVVFNERKARAKIVNILLDAWDKSQPELVLTANKILDAVHDSVRIE